MRKFWLSDLHIEETTALKYFRITVNLITQKGHRGSMIFIDYCMTYFTIHSSNNAIFHSLWIYRSVFLKYSLKKKIHPSVRELVIWALCVPVMMS